MWPWIWMVPGPPANDQDCEGGVKRWWRNLQLSDEHQLILGLLLVILVAISVLYCLGFASLVLRHAWETAPLPWSETEPPAENVEVAPTLPALPTTPSPTPP